MTLPRIFHCLICGKSVESSDLNLKCGCFSNYYSTLDFNEDVRLDSVLGEGNTPLTLSHFINSKFKIKKLFFKNEMFNPTGSFKDRGTAHVFGTLLKDSSIKKVAIASSGNAAISACAYAQLFNIECICFVSDHISHSKSQLIQALGGDLQVVPGYYSDVYKYLVDNLPSDTLNITPGQFVGHENGNMAIVEEIYQKSKDIDYIIVPVGNGSLLYGIYKGLLLLKVRGVIEQFPRIVGVEVKDNAPVAEAIRRKKDYFEVAKIPDSIGDAGIAAQCAYCSPKAISALKETDGFMVEIEESDLYWAGKDLIQEGILCEPTSASVVAALKYIPDIAGKNVVAVITGSGLKMIDEILHMVNHSI